MSEPVALLDPNAIVVVLEGRFGPPLIYVAPDKRRAVERIITYVRGDQEWVDLSSATEEELDEVLAEIDNYYANAGYEAATVYVQVPEQTDLEPMPAEWVCDF